MAYGAVLLSKEMSNQEYSCRATSQHYNWNDCMCVCVDIVDAAINQVDEMKTVT